MTLLARLHYALTTLPPCAFGCRSSKHLTVEYYVNAIPTNLTQSQSVVTISLTRPLTPTLLLRKCLICSKFDHFIAVLADLTTLLRRIYYTLIPFLPRSSGSLYCRPTDCSLIDDYKTFKWRQHKQTIDIAS